MKNIQTYIDNTLLKSDATPEMIDAKRDELRNL